LGSEQVKAVSETASFVSREAARASSSGRTSCARGARGAKGADSPRTPRRHRTGRNIQLNIKVCAETIERFYAISDRHGWVLGETFERAIAALERSSTN
jgi:hypothetical protein